MNACTYKNVFDFSNKTYIITQLSLTLCCQIFLNNDAELYN